MDAEHEVEHKGKKIKYPLIDRGIIYFPLCVMRKVSDLCETQAMEIKKFNTGNYKY